MSWKISADIRETFVEIKAHNPEQSLFVRSLNRKDQMLTGLKEALTFFPENFNPSEAHIQIRSDYISSMWRENWLPPIALLCTEGFQHVLEIGAQKRTKLFSLKPTKSSSPLPMDHCFGVTERVNAQGEVESHVQIEELHTISSKLELLKIDSIAICLLHSKKNNGNELQAAQYFKEKNFNVCTSFSENGYEDTRSKTVIEKLAKDILLKKFLEDITSLGFQKDNITHFERLPGKKSISIVEDRIFCNEHGKELSLSPMSAISISSTGVPQIKYENIGSEPGPVCFGKGVNLTIFDLIVLKNKIQFEDIKKLKIDHARVKKYLLLLSQQLRVPWEVALDKYLELAKTLIITEAEQTFGPGREYEGWMAPYLFKNTVSNSQNFTKVVGQVVYA